jgi:hypothetical protein
MAVTGVSRKQLVILHKPIKHIGSFKELCIPVALMSRAGAIEPLEFR